MKRNFHVQFCNRDRTKKWPWTITPKEPDFINNVEEEQREYRDFIRNRENLANLRYLLFGRWKMNNCLMCFIYRTQNTYIHYNLPTITWPTRMLHPPYKCHTCYIQCITTATIFIDQGLQSNPHPWQSASPQTLGNERISNSQRSLLFGSWIQFLPN